MILGIGNDMIDIRRVEKTLARHGSRFTERIFTSVERIKSEGRKNRVASYAKRFAAKEACAKALGTGISRGVWWKDMGVVNLPSGKPTMELTNNAKRFLEKMTPEGHKAIIHLTITDDFPWAQAFVIIEAVSFQEIA
ncbi:4'-phosphopantetheinyl transferase domain [Bartonella apihabitans]|uniref:Holo-[acyl-carrier-protein] synthase n=1 Tax=Bartonella apihabitans TaxID=2750929 RepID=A0A1U9MA19_9HYPH|nr:holo-ACP synthase [Bartonella apihabitans]MBH9994738.1 holo-ACP synthase [Bartonella sp. P0291]MBH9996917.1 holo-ACP synthase [Bartonella sp. M0192]MBH9999077.1 holo-ACP synthase [Bartonella sp. M0191]MBI0001248.1 holo-ACP synthase [Bartonella sp. W8122]MBI0007457.1 holo-ACP synthase [Bartonella sp. M0193]MBI0010368.1 holo-ACP synthase [Bartonella sp. M0176]